MPSMGLSTASCMSSMKLCTISGSRATSVMGIRSGNSRMDSFSEWSRMARGWLMTRTPAAAARSSSQVAATYSMSKGGSWRISTASKASSTVSKAGPATNQSSWSSRSSRGVAVACTSLPRQARDGRVRANTSWPRAWASRIMATLESL